jgi:hypothetical protein
MEIDIRVNTSERKEYPCSRSQPAARIIPKTSTSGKVSTWMNTRCIGTGVSSVSLLEYLGLTYSSFNLQFIRSPGKKNDCEPNTSMVMINRFLSHE